MVRYGGVGAVTLGGTCGSTKTAAGFANQNATRNNFKPGGVQQVSTSCGTLNTGGDQVRVFTEDSSKSGAIRVIATTTVLTSVAGGLVSMFSKTGFDSNTKLTASAVGSNGGAPLAQLTIRSSLATIDTTQSRILDQLIGGLLGGSIKAGVVSWQGLVDTKINLLSYLDQLISLSGVDGCQ